MIASQTYVLQHIIICSQYIMYRVSSVRRVPRAPRRPRAVAGLHGVAGLGGGGHEGRDPQLGRGQGRGEARVQTGPGRGAAARLQPRHRAAVRHVLDRYRNIKPGVGCLMCEGFKTEMKLCFCTLA